MQSEEDVLSIMRARSRRAVHLIFAGLALAALAVGLAAHHAPEAFALSPPDARGAANGFLYMGTAYVATLFAWDWLAGAD